MSRKIVHLPKNHGSLATRLRDGERSLGADSHVMAPLGAFTETPDFILPERLWRSPKLLQAYSLARKADIVHFNFGSSLLDPPARKHFLLDLPFYRSVQKLSMTFQGSDIRQSYDETVALSRETEAALGHKMTDSTRDGLIPPDEINRKQELIAKAEAHVDRLFYLNPDLATGLGEQAKFMPYPYPVVAGSKPGAPAPQARPLRVLHLATNRILKGTGLIEKALKEAGQNAEIEARILVKVPREDAKAAMAWADVLIDQVCLGWYGMQAVEVLAQGKPVLVWLEAVAAKRHLREENETDTGLINTTYETLAKTLVDLAENRERLWTAAKAAQPFVRRVHDPVKVVTEAYGDWL